MSTFTFSQGLSKLSVGFHGGSMFFIILIGFHDFQDSYMEFRVFCWFSWIFGVFGWLFLVVFWLLCMN